MQALIQALSLAALVAATMEYAMLLRRRESQRADRRERQHQGDTGLQGLVRVFLADSHQENRTYLPE